MLAVAELDAPGLATAAGMDLRLDDPAVATQFAGAVGRLFGAVGQPAIGHCDPEAAEDFLGLIFVNVHLSEPPPPVSAPWNYSAAIAV